MCDFCGCPAIEPFGRGEGALEELLRDPAPDPGALLRAVRDHVDAWEFEVFPQLVLAADPDDLAGAALWRSP